MKSQSGFTLIEVLATVIISTLLAGVMLTLLKAGTDQISEILPRQKAMSMYNIVSEQINWTARQAYWVRQPDDMTACPVSPAGTFTNLNGLVFYDKDCLEFGRYGFQAVGSRQFLMERKNGIFQAFKVAGDTVFITRGNDFGYHSLRRAITFELQIQYIVKGETRDYRTASETAYLRGGAN